MQTLQDDDTFRETEADREARTAADSDDLAGRYCGGGHPMEEPDDGRQRAVDHLVAVIRQASRELALLMAEIEADRRMT